MLPNPDRENRALLALIAGALHPYESEVTDQEIDAVLNSAKPLSAEGSMAMENLGDDPFSTFKSPKLLTPVLSDSGLMAAMHREADSAEPDDETKAKLDEKRREVLERLRNRKNEPPK